MPGVVVSVVSAVSVAATGLALTGFTVDVTLQVVGLVGLAGVIVTAQVRSMIPVNPPAGVAVIVTTLPVAAPACKLIAPPLLSAKLGGALTVTFTVVLDVTLPVLASLPFTVIT